MAGVVKDAAGQAPTRGIAARSKIWHQKLTFDVDFAAQTVWGTTEIDVVQKTADEHITLHAQQMEIESAALVNPEGADGEAKGKGAEIPLKFHNRATKQVVPEGEIRGVKETRDIHNFTLKYRSFLSEADAGELLIILPTFNVVPHKVPQNHPAKEEGGDVDWSMYKVKVKFKLQRPQGGLVFAGGLPGDMGLHLFSDGQCGGPRTWFPCWDAIDACNTFEVIVNVPPGNVALCSAPLQKRTTKKDGREQFKFKTRGPSSSSAFLPARCIALAAGPFVELQDAGMSGRVSHFCVSHRNGEQRLAFSTQFVSRSIEMLCSLLSTDERKQDLPCEQLNVVFVSNPPDEVEAYPGLLVMSSSLLYDASVISQSFETVRALVRGLAGQWFGLNGAVRPESQQDTWLLHGIVGYLTDICCKRLHGNCAYLFRVLADTKAVCLKDSATTPPLYSEAPSHPIEHSTELRMRKAALVVRLIEKRIGARMHAHTHSYTYDIVHTHAHTHMNMIDR